MRRSQDTRAFIILIASLGRHRAGDGDRRAAELARLGGAQALLRGEGLCGPCCPVSRVAAAADLRERLRDLEDEVRRGQRAETCGMPTGCSRCCAPSCAATR